jgi:hypothetical protein
VKKRVQKLIYFSFIVSFFISCAPETGPYPHPTYIEKKLPPITLPSTWTRAEEVLTYSGGAPACPEIGEGCYVAIPPIRLPSNYSTRYSELKNYSENDNLQAFFSLYSDWDIFFPDMSYESVEYNKLISGEYKLNFYQDSSIAIYDTSIATNNAVKLYKYKSEN